jgi:hypothetical protein
MDMMPITQEQLTQCRQQASGQLTDEQMTAFTGAPSTTSAPAPGPAPAATAVPVPSPTKSPVQDEGDGKHFVLTAPGQTDAREVTLVPGSKNSYIEDATGDKYIVMPDGSVTRIPNAKKTSTKAPAK